MTADTIRQIRHMARSGDTERAWAMFDRAGLARAAPDAEILTLKGRLIKDKALKADAISRNPLLAEAKAAYLAAAAVERATYPLINAATIALLMDRPAQAAELAAETIALLNSRDHVGETPYWLQATRAEAALLMGDIQQAQKALAEAMAAAPQAWEDHASTLRHFRLVLQKLGQSSDWVDAHRPPASLYFSGLIHIEDECAAIGKIRDSLDRIRPAAAFGALAAGADILVAEALVERGVDVFAVLPAPVATFRAVSVEAFGREWANRFDALMQQVSGLEIVPGPDGVSTAGIHVANQVAMGMALRNAAILESRAVALRVIATGSEPEGDSIWARHGYATEDISVDRSQHVGQSIPTWERQAVVSLSGVWDIDRIRAAGGRCAPGRDKEATAYFSGPVEALQALLGIDRESRASLAAIDCQAVDPQRPVDHDAIAKTLVRAGQGGHILISHTVAMILMVEAPRFRCEKVAEIASPLGNLPVYALMTSERETLS